MKTFASHLLYWWWFHFSPKKQKKNLRQKKIDLSLFGPKGTNLTKKVLVAELAKDFYKEELPCYQTPECIKDQQSWATMIRKAKQNLLFAFC